jgi:hypothetical protein
VTCVLAARGDTCCSYLFAATEADVKADPCLLLHGEALPSTCADKWPAECSGKTTRFVGVTGTPVPQLLPDGKCTLATECLNDSGCVLIYDYNHCCPCASVRTVDQVAADPCLIPVLASLPLVPAQCKGADPVTCAPICAAQGACMGATEAKCVEVQPGVGRCTPLELTCPYYFQNK